MHSRVAVLERLLRNLDRYYNLFITQGAKPILERFAEVSSFYEGKRVEIATAMETFVGTTVGLESTGLLRVRRDDGRIETVISADVNEA